MPINTRQVRRWPISKLRPHPRQHEFFPEPSERELCELMESMRRDGQQQPVVIRPGGTVVAGHNRCEAAKRLGWKHIDVVIRKDLADDPDAATAFLVRDNLIRRHLSPLARV